MNFARVSRLPSVLAATSLLLAGLLGTAVPTTSLAAVYDMGPDLALTMTPASSQVQSGGTAALTLTVSNSTTTIRECEPSPYPGKPDRCFNEIAGGPVSNVVLQVNLSNLIYQSATASGGFACSGSGTFATCSGGALPANGSAQVTIHALAPTLWVGGPTVTYYPSAVVNPSQTIDERSYTNNSASVSVTVLPPQPQPDLVVTSFNGPATVPAGGQATFTIGVANNGAAPATGVSVLLDGGNNGFNIVSSSGTGGFSFCLPAAERTSLHAICSSFGQGPMLAPGATVTITAVVQVTTVATTYTMSATIDPYNAVQESNETNNQLTRRLTIY